MLRKVVWMMILEKLYLLKGPFFVDGNYVVFHFLNHISSRMLTSSLKRGIGT